MIEVVLSEKRSFELNYHAAAAVAIRLLLFGAFLILLFAALSIDLPN